jgi:3-hydroxypropanoate dehydrogenase
MSLVDNTTLDLVFRNARTQNGWKPEPVTDAQLHALYDLFKYGPTSMNCQPARVIFVRGAEAKEKLIPCLSPGNVDKTRAAPVTAIIGHDMAFYDQLPKTFPPNPNARAMFAGNEALSNATAFRNGTLQGAYLMIAARMQGLDCGPMSGFDPAKVDAAFWAGTQVKTNFLVNLGHGDPAKVVGRLPRLEFAEACSIV